MKNEMNLLARKAGFNAALRHFRVVARYLQEVQEGANLADLLDASLEEGEIGRHQLPAITSALLLDKFAYAHRSCNLARTIENVEGLCGTLGEWGKFQLCLCYHHPQTGLFVINPKRAGAWDQALPLLKDELAVIFAGPAEEGVGPDLLSSALDDFVGLLEGRDVAVRPEFKVKKRIESLAERRTEPAPAAANPQSATGKRRMTPRYAVIVSNELFHNGNVESWKKIIESYKSKYPTLDVLIWYENERINDINALFKWGKVKHGNPIMVSVTGDDIKDVSKLQRYLFEGASQRFEAFLRGGVDRVLDLF
jgi:hypothetical protein